VVADWCQHRDEPVASIRQREGTKLVEYVLPPCPCGKEPRVLGEIRKVIHHYEVAPKIPSSFNWHDHLFGAHYSLSLLARSQSRVQPRWRSDRASGYFDSELLETALLPTPINPL